MNSKHRILALSLVATLGVVSAYAETETTTTTTNQSSDLKAGNAGTTNAGTAYETSATEDGAMVAQPTAASNTAAVSENRSTTQTTVVKDESAYGLNRDALRIGLTGGIAEVPGTSNNTDGAVGATAEIGLGHSPLSIGADFVDVGPNRDAERQMLLGRLAWHFVGDMAVFGYSYIGGNIGKTTDKVRAENLDNGYLTAGPIVGFDQPVSKHLTAGLEGKALWDLDNHRNGDPEFSGLGALKAWF